MLTPQDVRSVQFEKNLRGYRTEDVDRFLDKVEQQLEQDAEQMEALRKQVADLTAENETLRRNMQSYEADGDMLKSALINAQRMGENVIREANQKAEDILHRANLRGDDIIRDANELLQKASDRADEIISEANDKKLAEEREYDRNRGCRYHRGSSTRCGRCRDGRRRPREGRRGLLGEGRISAQARPAPGRPQRCLSGRELQRIIP